MSEGIYGQGTRVFDGIVYRKEAEAGSRQEAQAIVKDLKRTGARNVRVMPNDAKELFEIFVGIDIDSIPEREARQNRPMVEGKIE
jgi:hypothetical protein